jgi:hypothetical protein
MTATLHDLHKRGHGAQAACLRGAFTAAFLRAEHTNTATVQAFWDEFVKAHAVIYRGGAERMVA